MANREAGCEQALVALRGARKRYGWRGPWVLDGVDVEVAGGQIVELRGANGAGKSTLLRLLAGAAIPTRGARIASGQLTAGYAPETLVPPPFSAGQYLRHQARMRDGWPRYRSDAVAEEITTLERRLDCAQLHGVRMGALSKGSLRKIVLIGALLGSPELLVLDEAFDGLDRGARRSLREVLEERRAQGAAVVLSDHRQSEGRSLADVVLQVGGGEVVPAEAEGRTRLEVAAAAVDEVLRELLSSGWHIESVLPVGSDAVVIDAREPRR